MADPIKTTVQEALDHIKEWTTKGEKDKAVRGLQEILHFDPSNADAQKMLSELQAAPAAIPAPAPTTGAFKLDMDLKPAAIQPTVAAPAPMPVAPAPVAPPKPVTPPPVPMPPKPVAPQPTAPSVPTPAPTPVSPLKPLSSPPPSPAPSAPTSGIPPASMMNKVQGMSQNLKWIIFAGALLIAVIGGYLFYKNVLSTSEPITSDIQQQVENNAASTDTSSDAATSTVSDTPAPTDTSATDAATTPTTPSSDLTPAATDPAAVTPPISQATSSPGTSIPAPQPVGEKVKRR